MTLLIALAISAGAYAKEITANAHSIDLTKATIVYNPKDHHLARHLAHVLSLRGFPESGRKSVRARVRGRT